MEELALSCQWNCSSKLVYISILVFFGSTLWRSLHYSISLKAFAMADQFQEVPLPPSVEQLLLEICMQQNQPPPDAKVRLALASLGEEAALDTLHKISSRAVRSLGGFILHMVRNDPCTPQKKMVWVSPHQSPSSSGVSPFQSPSTCSVSPHQSPSTCRVYSPQGSLSSLFRAPVFRYKHSSTRIFTLRGSKLKHSLDDTTCLPASNYF